ncbi:polysaccharide deacetylase family protein [Clostridium cylindrosporum]|uniref:Peptidoglycan-N-acetylmuramic acid deacetylase PdaC n=1 Tax=Clostridium cylindrosporum DSM 605 TaxID=1121307 RepID=A0A0J8D7D2_CLOCY|nr:polysaccharide deacetylase family protein [Clostridium cylindrosporum]KMT21970.1 peptidoglycan-N-acetylmuramic acid deacetylase PdaC [Clostridium cylindrosporum DSM 605]
MKKKLIFIGIGIIILFLVLLGTYKLMASREYQLFGGLTNSVKTDQKVVALTFDDGPTKNVDKILPLLDKYKAKVTFFLIGREVEENPKEAKKIIDAGHQVGNHTYSHNRMVFKTPSYIKKEVNKTDRLIKSQGYKGKIDFRPPNGKKLIGLPYYLHKRNKDTIMWNMEPDTYYSNASDKIKYVKDNVKPGSIILMHPMYDKTNEEFKAIEGVLKELSKEGYKFITVDELQKLEVNKSLKQ